jgi:uncharacterized cupin superfamily protein
VGELGLSTTDTPESKDLRAGHFYDRAVVAQARLERTIQGLVPAGDGWFVLNARDARWRRIDERRRSAYFEGDTRFPQVAVGLVVLAPGEPMAMYHWEVDQEDFLVLAGEALLVVEGEERPLREWDFVHCPPGTKHVIVGAGEMPCTVLAVGARERQNAGGEWGAYVVEDAARRHGASVDAETTDEDLAYAAFPLPEPAAYGAWLPW